MSWSTICPSRASLAGAPLRRVAAGLSRVFLFAIPLLLARQNATAAPPDLTQPGVIATIDRSGTYNLGPTGMRGWIYLSGGYGTTYGQDGTMSGEARQILVTVASTPASTAGIQVDDVILGVAWGSGGGAVPVFTSDSRKAFGNAITEAEKTENGGILRIKRWRPADSSTLDVSINLAVMGSYSDTAPYNCPKSALILANARNNLVGQLLANSNYLGTGNFSGPVHALALLSAVQPGDPDYATVQTRLQTYARTVASGGPQNGSLPIWAWGHLTIFLSEYYLSTGDANVLPGINQFALKLAQSQSQYGTFGHSQAFPRPDGSGRMSCIGYGPVNNAGLPANTGMVLARKALVAGNQSIDPQIDAAIQRGSDFFAWYVNKGSVPYGEHAPGADDHSSNGKNPNAAVFFGLQDNRLTETEYYTRMSIAGYNSRELGHTGQGFSYLWEAMGANVGGSLAVAEYLKPVRWQLDLARRTDGSFAYDGAEQYGGGSTSGGTYLGAASYNGLDLTASRLLALSLPYKRLYITGKNANPANELSPATVAHAVAAANYKFDRTARSNSQLISDLSDYDPVTRNLAAKELSNKATRTLTSTELTTLRTMLTGPDANARMGACQTLGLLQDSTAMATITQRLDKTVENNPWVRAAAAVALRDYGTAANNQVSAMLTAFVNNAADPDTIVWSDPLQNSNSQLAWALFDSAPGTNYFDFSATTINAPKNVLYPAVSTGFKQPDSASRSSTAGFAYNRILKADVQAMPMDFINLCLNETQVDRMWSASGRRQGIRVLSKHKFFELMPIGLSVLDVPENFEHGSADYLDQAVTEIATYGDAARWTLPTLRSYLNTWDPTSSTHVALVNAINSIDAAIAPAAGISYLKAAANRQVVTTTGSKAITLTGSSAREPSVSFTVLTQPSHGTLTGTAPNLTYTPDTGYTGPDQFTFRTADTLTTSDPATVGIVVGPSGNGLKGEYFNNADFSSLVLTRTDAQVNFDWGTGSPSGSIGADTFSVRWSGQLLIPETGNYTFSTLASDGVRLYLNGQPVISNFVDQSTKWIDGNPIALTAGQIVEIQMEYYENTGSAVAKLKWTGPSVAGVAGDIIPQAYLFDGSTATNRTPYAHAQSITLVQNTSQGITLTGSGGTLTYSVLSQPAHGTLTGTAPYLTYTPATNYNGTDSFTFLVNNGTGNSSPATVSISILAGLPVTYTWASAVSGNMSTAANWVSSNTPPAAGQAFCSLNFTPTGTYTATHDLNTGFQLNQLNMASTLTLSGTSSLSFSANGAVLPQLNQNSTNQVTIGAPIEFSATTTLGGLGGKVILTGLISGSGGMVKTSSGTLQINNFTNTYTGGTILDAGIVTFPAGNGSATPHFGTGPITINPNATLSFNRTVLSNAITLNACTLSGGNSFSSVFSGPVTLNGITTINLGTSGGFQISGNVSGTGGFTTIGTTQWTMNGSNTYTGPTTIQAGTIRYQAVGAVAPGALIIATGGKANLNYTGNKVVASLTLGGIDMPPGTYGGSSSSAAFKNDAYFTSTSVGTITVLPPTTTALALTSGSSPANPGTPLTFTATVSGSSPTGNVAFYADATLLGTSALNGSYQASLTTSSLALGTYSVTAQYLGNATNAASVSNAITVVISSFVPPFPANPVAGVGNNQVILTWSASNGATSYNVKRSLTSGGPFTLIGTSPIPSFTDTSTSNGITYFYVISAVNDVGESPNSSQVSAIPFAQPSSAALASLPGGSATYGTAVTFTATVSVSGSPATGTVTFKDGAAVLGTRTLNSGSADFTTSALAVGNHNITAIYGGDGTYGASISPQNSFTVDPKALTITGVTASNKVYDGTTTAVLAGGAVSGGLVGSETVTVVPGSGAFSSASVGTWPVTASGYSLGGAHAGNYALSAQPAVPNASITARTIQLTGSRTYDGTTSANANILTIANNVDGGNLTLGGSASLAGKDVGSHAIVPGTGTPARVQSATGSTTTSSMPVTLTSTPTNGNTLIAVISTRGNSTNRVSSITGGGVSWFRVSQAANSSGTTTEIWYGPNVTNGTTGITMTLAATLNAAAVLAEYSGLLIPTSVDQTASNVSSSNSTAASTGTTSVTTQANELWLGGIGIADGRRTLNAPYGNSFLPIASSKSGSGSGESVIYALEKFVNSTGNASTSGTISASDAWSGAIATFKAGAQMNLSLSGPAAANYTLTGMTGSVTIAPKPLTVTGLAASNRTYNGTTTATLTGTAALLTAEAPGTGTTSDGKPYTGDTVTLTGNAAGSFTTRHAGNGKSVSVTGLTISGAQAGNYSLAPPTGLTATVSPLSITVSAVNATKTYDGTTTAAGTPTLNPALVSGDTTAALFQEFSTPTAGISNKTIIPSISISDGNNGSNYAVTPVNFTTGTIYKATATVTLGNLYHIYDGSTKSASCTVAPSGLSWTLTYNGSASAPSAVGSYTVVATVNDTNWSGSASDTLLIKADSMTTWRTAHFTGSEISTGLSDDGMDPDSDGLTNSKEYIFGTDPRSFSPQPLTASPAPGGNIALQFTAVPASGTGYAGHTRIYTIESAPSPTGPWQPLTGYTSIPGNNQTVSANLPPGDRARFFRLSVRIE